MENNKVNDAKVCYTHQRQLCSRWEEENHLLISMLPADPPRYPTHGEFTSIADISQDSLLALPAEIRNKIYTMVIADTPGIPEQNGRRIGEFSLCQPALAQVNRQLRHDILPMWYSEKSFGIRIFAKRLSEADQVWQGFLDRFKAHTAGADGTSYLSRIQRLEVELWHPAFVPYPPFRLTTESAPDDFYRVYDPAGLFSLSMSNGVYLQFGPVTRPIAEAHPQRVGDNDTDWTDRAAVRALLLVAIVKDRSHGQYPIRLVSFWKTFPFERLVDLVMMIAAECKEAARLIRVGTSFGSL